MLETPDDFEARLVREGRERYLREIQRRKLARMQADEAARASPLQVDISQARLPERSADPARDGAKASDPVDLYQAALQPGSPGGTQIKTSGVPKRISSMPTSRRSATYRTRSFRNCRAMS